MEKESLAKFLNAVKLRYGYDFTGYSQASIVRRISKFMSSNQIQSIDQLKREIISKEAFFEEFVQQLSVTVTEMFRDPLFFLSLREHVMPRLATYPVIKIWLAGCATGEEVYSLAIMLKEEGLYDRSVIYATDINQQSVKTAKNGIYSIDKMKSYTSNYLQAGGKESFSSYYKADSGAVLFDKDLRNNIVFAPHNLTADRSFNEFQLIICRNVLIYFNQQLQKKVINLFYESLCSLGFLALGNKESLLFSDKKNEFKEFNKKEKIFMKSS